METVEMYCREGVCLCTKFLGSPDDVCEDCGHHVDRHAPNVDDD